MVIKPATALYGTTYWAAWYEHMKPAYEVFKYFGDGRDGLHYFQSMKNKTLIGRSTAQCVGDPHFKPFVVNGSLRAAS